MPGYGQRCSPQQWRALVHDFEELKREVIDLRANTRQLPQIVIDLQRQSIIFKAPFNVHFGDDAEVSIGAGTIIYPGVHIYGKVSIGENAKIHNDATLINCTIGPKTRIGTNVFMEDVQIGNECFVDFSSVLKKRCKIGDRCRIGPHVFMEYAHVGNETVIEFGSRIQGGFIGDTCCIGPNAILRYSFILSDTHIGDRATIEHSTIHSRCIIEHAQIKRSTLLGGVIAKHDCYIGDASIGAGSNIGAGVVFCNYNGVQKNRTVLGENVFVGSGTMLVAPLIVAKNSYIAAGSVVTRNVNEPGTLVIARGNRHSHEEPHIPNPMVPRKVPDVDEGEVHKKSYVTKDGKGWHIQKPT